MGLLVYPFQPKRSPCAMINTEDRDDGRWFVNAKDDSVGAKNEMPEFHGELVGFGDHWAPLRHFSQRKDRCFKPADPSFGSFRGPLHVSKKVDVVLCVGKGRVCDLNVIGQACP